MKKVIRFAEKKFKKFTKRVAVVEVKKKNVNKRVLKIKKKIKQFNNNFFLNKVLKVSHNKKIILKISSLKIRAKQFPKASIRFSRKHIKKSKKIFNNSQYVSKFVCPINLYNKFLFFIFKVGKKMSWENKFSLIFDALSLKLGYSKATLLLKIFIRLFTRVEVKKVKARKRITFIPIFIKLPRSLFLALKWIFLVLKKKGKGVSLSKKLFNELLQLLVQKSCLSIQKHEENNMLAFKNRSNIHYRWQKTR